MPDEAGCEAGEMLPETGSALAFFGQISGVDLVFLLLVGGLL